MPYPNYQDLAADFLSLTKKAGGPSRGGAGVTTIAYLNDSRIEITLGTRDIPGMPAETCLGKFLYEYEAIKALTAAVIDYRVRINKYNEQRRP